MMFQLLVIFFGLFQSLNGLKCSETGECKRQDHTGLDERILCYGLQGCRGASLGTTGKILCSGYAGCQRVKFTSAVSVFCNGFQSCQRARGLGVVGLHASDQIVCQGYKACESIVGGLNAPTIKCDGDLACTNYRATKATTELNINGETVNCNGHGVCRGSIITSTGTVSCDGDSACADTFIKEAETAVLCAGKRACKDARIWNTGTLYAYGWFGALNAEISNVADIRAYGFNSMLGATIDVAKGGSVSIDGKGFRALNQAYLNCKPTSTCTIQCFGNSCKDFIIDASRTSIFSVTPSACDPDDPDYLPSKKDASLPGKVTGIHCPVITRPTNDLTEEEVQLRIQQVRNSFRESEDYIEAMKMNEMAEQELNDYFDEKLDEYTEILEELDYEYDEYDDFNGIDEQILSNDLISSSATTQLGSSMLVSSNLITGLIVFALTGGSMYCYIKHKYKDVFYKQLPM